MEVAFEVLADYLSRLDSKELEQVANRAYEIAKDRHYSDGETIRRGLQVTTPEPWELDGP